MLRHIRRAKAALVTWLSSLEIEKEKTQIFLKGYLVDKSLKVDQILFFLSLFTLPLGFALRGWGPSSYVFGLPLDFLSFSLTLPEILFLISITIYLKREGLSISLRTTIALSFGLSYLIFLALFSPLPGLSLWRVLKIIEIGLLAFYVRRNFLEARFFHLSALSFLLSVFIQSIIGTIQYLHGSSLNVRFLGGHFFDLSTPGVAKVGSDFSERLRAYGTTVHPNVLGGMIAISLPFVMVAILQNKGKLRWLLFAVLFFLSVGLVLTFSRESYLAAIVGVFVLLFFQRQQRLAAGVGPTLLKVGLVVLLPVLFFWLPVSARISGLFDAADPSFFQRQQLVDKAISLYQAHPIFGVGLGQFIPAISQGSFVSYDQLQPVHNIFLLAMVETGAVGVFVFSYFISLVAVLLWRKRKSFFGYKAAIFASFAQFLILSSFDHYFLTLDQGVFLFGVLVGAFTAKW